MAGQPKVVAVVVTHNRKELLGEALDAIAAQQRGPDTVIVVDNASSDGSAELVKSRYPFARLLALKRNCGGAGGFAAGIARALDRHAAELLWLLDDDTIPAPGALAALLTARARSGALDRGSGSARWPAVVVASRVRWIDGRDHPMNTPRARPGVSRSEIAAAETIGCLPIRSASFVSVLIDADAVRRSGLPIADYFLWNDDFEFTTRLLRKRPGLLCHDSIVTHRTRTFGATDADPGERFFYEVRNKIWLFTRSSGLAPGERMIYAVSTVRRWARTFMRSKDRAVLCREFRRGLSSGLRTKPRPTVEVLQNLESI